MLFDNNSDGPIEPTGSTINITKPVRLSEEEAIEFLSNHNLATAYTLVDIENFSMTAYNIGQRLNISKSEAETILEALINMGLIQQTGESGKYQGAPLYFDDAFVSSSDLMGIFMKFSNASMSKLTSKDVFCFRYEALSKQVLHKYHAEMDELIEKIAKESIGNSDCEVYAVGYSFTKLTRTRKDK